ncbi:MAG: AMP-binding protein [Gammaproteobacteria bacterium]
MSKIWLKQYPPGIPAEVETKTFPSLVQLFTDCCRRFGSLTAVSHFGARLTFTELEQQSRYFAAYLQQVLALKKGSRLAIMLPNLMQYYIAMLGGLRAGLIIVNLNPLYTAVELEHQLIDSGAETLVVLANVADKVEQVLSKTALKTVVITEVGDLLGRCQALGLHLYLKYIKRQLPRVQIPGALKFKHLLAAGRRCIFQAVPLTPEDIAYLQYTGGTTGTPKGAMLTHGNLVANILQTTTWLHNEHFQAGQETAVVSLPLYHIFSLTVCLWCFLYKGFNALLITDPRDIATFIRQLRKNPWTILVGINTLFLHLLNQPQFRQLDFKTLKLVVAGGAPVQETIAEEWFKLTGSRIIEGYGLTEASPVVTVNPLNVTTFHHSIGLPLPSTDVMIRDQGQDVGPGEYGELLVKGPQVMLGYWNNPAETQAVFSQDGWLQTGDIGYYDAQGFFYLVDRKKDMILVSGFNVYPSEVEAVLMHHPHIREAAVVGVPDAVTGEAVKAFIVKKEAALSAVEVKRFCSQYLTGYKLPKWIEFVTSLPKSTVGKVLRRVLKSS